MNQHIWATLFAGYRDRLYRHGCRQAIAGLERLGIGARFEGLDVISERLYAGSGWRIAAVDGLLPDREFFALLSRRTYPVVDRLREAHEIDFAELPDTFHDTAGHLPLLMDRRYARFLEAYTALVVAHLDDAAAVARMARIYWYSIETGLVLEDGVEKVFGAAVLTSHAECANARSPATRKLAFELDAVLATPFDNYKVQPGYFVLPSFDSLLTLADRLGDTR